MALRRITAKEPHLSELGAVSGRFWAPDYDSECEDLGDADVPAWRPDAGSLQQQESASSIDVARPSFPKQSSAGGSLTGSDVPPAALPLRPPHAPGKKAWHGPLPPPRITPANTFGDYILPALEADDRRRRRHPGAVQHRGPRVRDPKVSGFQKLDQRTGHLHRVSTRLVALQNSTWAMGQQAEQSHGVRLFGPKRRLVRPILCHTAAALHPSPKPRNPTPPAILRGPTRRLVKPFIDAAPPRSYQDVLMAGGFGGRKWNRDATIRGAPSNRRRDRGQAPAAGHEERDHGQRGRGGLATAGSTSRGGPHPAGGAGTEGRGRGRGNSRPPPNLAVQSDDGQQTAGSAATIDDTQDKKRKRRDQTVKRDCVICTEEHFTNQCPLLRGPKPTVAYCGAAEDGLGFFQIQSARNSQIVDTFQASEAALITVEAGDVSAQLLQAELARMIPVRWDWEVQRIGGKSFVVPFPSKEELERMIAIRTITTKNKEGTLVFEEFVDDVQPIKLLDQVWVTVTRVPRALCSFLPLWAVGSIIGATQKVDMAHLRETGQVRIRVAVMDIKKIPKPADVCAGTGIYRLYFQLEEAPQGKTVNPEDDDLLGDSEDDMPDGDREMEDAGAPPHPSTENTIEKSQRPSSHNLPPQQQTSLVHEAIDLACEQLLQEISTKVMLDADDGSARKSYSPLTDEELANYNMLVNSSNNFLRPLFLHHRRRSLWEARRRTLICSLRRWGDPHPP